MMTFISCAKTMTDHSKVEVPTTGTPQFQAEAIQHALDMSRFSAEELERLLRVNSKIAAENYLRFQDFCSEANKALPALLAYTGIVFKRICPQDFTAEDFQYVQDHLRITSFLYGLLRPLDLIKNYRLEGDVRLPEHEGISMFDYWKPILTDEFIKSIKAQGGTLVNLASNEMKDLFDWKRIEQQVRVITPEFQVWKKGKLTTVVIYTKMCRGEMARYIIKNRIEKPEELKSFNWEGFCFDAEHSTESQIYLNNNLTNRNEYEKINVCTGNCQYQFCNVRAAEQQITKCYRQRKRRCYGGSGR